MYVRDTNIGVENPSLTCKLDINFLRTANTGAIQRDLDKVYWWDVPFNLRKCQRLVVRHVNLAHHLSPIGRQAATEQTHRVSEPGILMNVEFKPSPQCPKPSRSHAVASAKL